jgi:hypothetical protein
MGPAIVQFGKQLGIAITVGGFLFVVFGLLFVALLVKFRL